MVKWWLQSNHTIKTKSGFLDIYTKDSPSTLIFYHCHDGAGERPILACTQHRSIKIEPLQSPWFPHRVSCIWPLVWRVKHKSCTKEDQLPPLLYRICSNLSLCICLYCRWRLLLSWSPIRHFCKEQHSFNKCTLPCRRDLPGATARLERKCCLMNIYWLWIFIKLTSLWPASGFVTYVAVKWLSKVFKPVLKLFEVQRIERLPRACFLLEQKGLPDVLMWSVNAWHWNCWFGDQGEKWPDSLFPPAPLWYNRDSSAMQPCDLCYPSSPSINPDVPPFGVGFWVSLHPQDSLKVDRLALLQPI